MTYEPQNVTHTETFSGAGSSVVLYTVPTGRKAKITFVNMTAGTSISRMKVNGAELFNSSSTFGILPYITGGDTAGTWNAVDFGVYLNEGDEITLSADSALTASLFVSLIEEY